MNKKNEGSRPVISLSRLKAIADSAYPMKRHAGSSGALVIRD